MKRILTFAVTLAAAASMFCGCSWFGWGDKGGIDKVMILYSAGFNSLSSQLREDIYDLQSGYIPTKDSENVLLVAGHHTLPSGGYNVLTQPVLIRLYKDKNSQTVLDTLATMPAGSVLTRAADMRQMLEYIEEQFPSKSYGFVFTSHATGWLPAGYYESPEKYDGTSSSSWVQGAPRNNVFPDGVVPYTEPELLPGPQVKSIGQSRVYENGSYSSYEMSLADFASAFPFHCDYILLDACLMGGIETAYALRNVCDRIGFSQAEVLADGFDYETIASRLLLGTKADAESVCRDYFERYQAKTGEMQSATISLVDCKALGEFARVCRSLFNTYRSSISSLDFTTVQRFYRSYHHWYFDLEDILVKAGMSDSDRALLEDALSRCIIYKGATESFLPNSSGFKIESFSGLSMYLPSAGSSYLNAFYKTLDWNIDSGLVE